MKIYHLFTEDELKTGTGSGQEVATVVDFGDDEPTVVYWWATGSIETYFSFVDFESTLPAHDCWLNAVNVSTKAWKRD